MSPNLQNCNLDTFQSNAVSFAEALKDYKNWHDIPLLNYTPLHELKDLSLVRFRGMIQDMFNPEIYLERYEVLLSSNTSESNTVRMQEGKYRDCFVVGANESVNYGSISNTYGERQTMFVISVPGINNWVSDIEYNENSKLLQLFKSNHPNKANGSEDSFISPNKSQKRQIIEECEQDMQTDEPVSVSHNSHKKQKTKDELPTQSNSNRLLSAEYHLNSPISERPSKACMVKIYSNFGDFALNSVIEVIGFLSIDPSLDAITSYKGDEFDCGMDESEVQASNPPPSLIPRLHAIAVKNLEHVNPLLDMTTVNFSHDLNMEAIRNDLRIILTQCLFGDNIAADYLLSHLLSRIYVRTDYETLGHSTLNISNIPSQILPEYTQQLYEILESLLPASHYFPMTLQNMNTVQFVPKKDYKTNRLTSGLLQLAPHTHLVLDETKLQPGKLESNGVLGVQSLSHLIKMQQIKYNFEFFDIDFNSNIPILILSEGKSMLPSNFHIPLTYISDTNNISVILETLKAAKHFLQPKLQEIRKYLTIAKICNFDMNSNCLNLIQNDFVQMRRENKNIGPDELHSLLVLSRLISISKGKNKLDEQSWIDAKQMEIIRRKRCEKISTM